MYEAYFTMNIHLKRCFAFYARKTNVRAGAERTRVACRRVAGMRLAHGADRLPEWFGPVDSEKAVDVVRILVNASGVFYGSHGCVAALNDRELGRSPVLAAFAEATGQSIVPCTLDTFCQWLRFDAANLGARGVVIEHARLAALLTVRNAMQTCILARTQLCLFIYSRLVPELRISSSSATGSCAAAGWLTLPQTLTSSR
jgi:hypothetical protein